MDRHQEALDRVLLAEDLALAAELPAHRGVWVGEADHWVSRANLLAAVATVGQRGLTRRPGWRLDQPGPPMVFGRFGHPEEVKVST